VTPPPDYIPKGEQLLYQTEDGRTRVRSFTARAGDAA
jgi:hypothetical protein